MRKLLLLSAGVCLVLGLAGRVAAADETQAIIDKAIKAHGGKDKLAKAKASEVKTKGKIHLGGGIAFTGETYVQVPDKFKTVLELEVNNMNINVTTVFNGDKAWVKANGEKIKLDDNLKKEIQ